MIMLKHLINFGIETEVDESSVSLNYEIDITDVTILETQINNARKVHRNLIELNDKLQEEYMLKKQALTKRLRELHIDYPNRTDRLNAMSTDIEYTDLQDTIEALKESIRMVGNRIDFVKSDIRILTNSMYRKM